MGARQFGARGKRLEDPALPMGAGRFVDDVKLPDALFACFVRSPHAHARIGAIDAAAALALPGVHAVLTAGDLPEPMRSERIPNLMTNPAIKVMRTQHALARQEVCYVGEAVAVVIADSRHLAEDAAALVSVDYDVLPAVADCRDAVKPGAPRAHSDIDDNIAAVVRMEYGDVDAAFAAAPHVYDEAFWLHRGGGMAMETRAVAARHDAPSDLLTVWSSTQTPHLGRRMLADLTGRHIEQIRMIAPDVGGGFGPKAPFYAEEAVIPAAAMKLGRPIKWVEDRREHFLSATQERDQYFDVAIAVDHDGKILGVRGTLLHDTGAFMPWGIIMPYIAAVTIPGPYVVPSYRLACTVAITNNVATTPVRGAGRPQAVFAMERLMDRVARELELDRAEVRRRNFIQPEQMHYAVGLIFRDGMPLVYHGGDYPRSQAAAIARAGYDGFRERQAQARQTGRYLGIGLANYVEGTGLGPFEGVTIRVLPSGKVSVATGATNQGQGQRTALSQIVADRIGCRIDDIVMTMGDTAAISQGIGAFASRQAVNAGSSALMAGRCGAPEDHGAGGAHARRSEGEIDLADGEAIARGGNQPRLSFGELARLRRHGRRVVRARPDAGPRAHRLFHGAASLLLQRYPYRRSRGRRIHRRRLAARLHGSERQRHNQQPAHRRRPGQGRRRTGHRQRAVRGHEVRRECAAAHHHVRRLSASRRHRRAGLPRHPYRDPEPAQSARRQRRGRGRHHSGAGRDRQRHRGRAVTVRRALCRSAVDAGAHRRCAACGRRLRTARLIMEATPSDTPFWRFSLGFYRDPAVAASCIELQDQAGVDVNMLLFLLWSATLNRTLSQAAIADLDGRIGAWREAAVIPLRALRRTLKSPPPVIEPGAAEVFRTRVKNVELEAERLQQHTMYALVPSLPFGSAASPAEAARANVAAYAAAMSRVFPPDAVETLFRALADVGTR